MSYILAVLFSDRPNDLQSLWQEWCRDDMGQGSDARSARDRPAGVTDHGVTDHGVIDRSVIDLSMPEAPDGWLNDRAIVSHLIADVSSAPVGLCRLARLRRAVMERTGALDVASVHELLDGAAQTLVERCTDALMVEARTDALTQLHNRRALQEDLAGGTARALRHGHVLSVVIMDVDGLKTINDQEGHAAGDAALRGFADALRQCLRDGDRAYRYGGDEFVLLLSHGAPGAVAETSNKTSDAADAAAVAARIRAVSPVSFSWGAASYPNDTADPEHLIERADAELLTRRIERGYHRTSPTPSPFLSA